MLLIAWPHQYDDGQMEDYYDDELELILVEVARTSVKRKRTKSTGKEAEAVDSTGKEAATLSS